MAAPGLRSFVAGDNILVGKTLDSRPLRDSGELTFNLIETVETEDREWVALTQAAAEGAVTAKSGEASMTLTGTDVTYSHGAVEQNRVLKAFVYRCSAQRKTLTPNPPPE